MVDFKALITADKPKDRIVSAKKGRIEAIHVIDGKEVKVQYGFMFHNGKEINNQMNPCMECNTERLCCGETASCPVCDGLMTVEEYNESQKEPEEIVFKVEAEKEVKFEVVKEPLITLETSKETIKTERDTSNQYPLTKIDIDENAFIKKGDETLTLTEAKERVKAEIELFNFTILNIVNKKDFYTNKKGKECIMKSGTRKIQLALNISTTIVSKNWEKDNNNRWVATFIVRAETQSGRFTECIGLCEQDEKNRTRTLHDTIATAQTRATSRAILDLAGFGAVSMEEIE